MGSNLPSTSLPPAPFSPSLSSFSTLSAPSVRGIKAAREFEAQLIGSLLDSLEKTFSALPGDNVSAAADNYNYLGTRALSDALAERGGFGIAQMIEPYLLPK